ncbi:peptidase inhibitor family I36 protein [Streptomyces sp. NPDC021096]|uniref:peptidase inhibitor family I36 protein n=1 Tax=Streptomyces sp. NPDC021096 TaxID=3154792 RepID=UPI0033DDA30D
MYIRLVAVTAVAAALALVSAPGASAKPVGGCGAGQLCLWPKADFRGQRQVSELATIDIESCMALPAGVTGASLVNRTGRPVTTYQSATCAETGEFVTYPSGTWVPESPYVVRAYKVWES